MNKKIVYILLLLILLMIISMNKYMVYFSLQRNNIENGAFKNSNFQINYNDDKSSMNLYFSISYFSHTISLKYNIIEIIYYITIFDGYQNKINPIDLSFYYNLHIFCKLKSYNNASETVSFPDFNDDKNLICTEHFHIKEKIELAIQIYFNKNNYYTLLSEFSYFTYQNSDFSYLYNENDNYFSPFLINQSYNKLINEINKTNPSLLLKSSYIQQPTFNLKTNKIYSDNNWAFKNIYNHYFCFCNGINCNSTTKTFIFQNCKYNYYLYIIDNKRNLYEKTDYLFADFIAAGWNSDDVFPIFEKMIKQQLPAHYITFNKDIYNKYCFTKDCTIIISERYIDGDFLEKYLKLMLKLKVAVAGAIFPAINSLFYNIEYITSINIGHGVKYFKSFLYKDYTSPLMYNKLVLAPSRKIISVATKFGWREDNIIKICLPKWDKYWGKKQMINKDKIGKFIFFFFTWRDLKDNNINSKNRMRISPFYINNIINILNDSQLNKTIVTHNITLLIGLHQNLNWVKIYLQKKYNFIKIIRNDMISDCLMKSSLMVTDFSSVAFDLIYQRKPVIIYIPDYEDPNIKNLYSDNYYNVIKSLGNGTIYFENKFNDFKEVINKIIYYINNDFKLEKKIEEFYDGFELKCEPNNIQTFIDILKKIT